MHSRRPLELVIADKSTPEDVRTKLIYTQGVLAFAKAHGLKTARAYTHYVHMDQPAVSFLVQAAYADRLEFKTWWFPVVGSVPYLGFFSKVERDKKADELSKEGFDVAKSGVGAFSSLGWLEDPVYSPMLKRDDAELAHLYFHELTHRTLWLPGSVEFNENIAEYVGRKLTLEYLDAKKLPVEVRRKYLESLDDDALLRSWLNKFKAELKDNYDKKAGRKAEIIRSYVEERRPVFKQDDLVKGRTWNNASIMGASLYAPDFGYYEGVWVCLGSDKDMGAFLKKLRKAVEDRSCGLTIKS